MEHKIFYFVTRKKFAGIKKQFSRKRRDAGYNAVTTPVL